MIVLVFCVQPVIAKYKHCEPNQEKLDKIMANKAICQKMEGDNANADNLYEALAQIAACDDYDILKITITEKFKTRGLDPCVVKLKEGSASIGVGVLDIRTSSRSFQINWDARHDLSGKNNTVKYWLESLEPQVVSGGAADVSE